MVNDIFLLMKVVDSLSNLQPVLLHLLDWHFLGHLTSQIAINAVLEYKIEVDFVRKCILQFDNVSILQRRMYTFFMFVRTLAVQVPDRLQSLLKQSNTKDCLWSLLVIWNTYPRLLLQSGLGSRSKFYFDHLRTPVIFLETDCIILFCSQLSEQSIVSYQIQIENNNSCTFYHLYNFTMTPFRGQKKTQDQNEETALSFDHKLYNSLKSFIKLLPFVEFTVNYGYAVENVWVTMLMITHGTPDPVDCFVWIVPVIIAIFLRPYLIRYVHNINYKVYRQITLVSVCLMAGAFGCYIVGLSCQLNKKTQLFRRVFQCSIGWTIMDVAFQFCQFLTEKIEIGYNELHQTQKMTAAKEGEEQAEDTSKKINFQFYGLLLGYIVSLIICWAINGRTVKQFYRCCKYAYWTVGGLALITGLRMQIQSFINLPKRQVQDKQSEQKVFLISYDANYYLPGLQQLLRANMKTYSLLLLHFVIIFVNDVIMIYTTMWFSEPSGVQFAKHGQALTNGLQYGGISLLLYTVVDNLTINNKMLASAKYFEGTLLSLVIFSSLTYYWYGSFSFLVLGSLIALTNQFYRHTIFNSQSQNNPLFQRCIEITERIQKIFILSFMPTIVMLILQRDDIQDCIFWASAMASLGIIAFKLATRGDPTTQQANESSSKTVKVDKIQ